MSGLPQLLDRKQLATETGLPRSAIDAIFRACPVVVFQEAPRKVFVRRTDVERLIAASTYRSGERVR